MKDGERQLLKPRKEEKIPHVIKKRSDSENQEPKPQENNFIITNNRFMTFYILKIKKIRKFAEIIFIYFLFFFCKKEN